MYVRASAPKPIGGVLDDAIRLYREAFPKIWLFNVAAAVAMTVPAAIFSIRAVNLQKGNPMAALAIVKSPGFWLSYAFLMLIYLVIQGALISALDAYAAGREASLGTALGVGVTRLPRLIIASIVLMIMISVGCMLLLIPGIYLWGIFQLTFVAIIVDDAGTFESFGVSKRLIKGNWWRATTIFTVAVVMIIVLSFVAGMLNGIVAAMFGLGSTVALVSRLVLGAIVNVILIPLMPCFLLAMYYDLKLRHEGGDLAARVNALAPS